MITRTPEIKFPISLSRPFGPPGEDENVVEWG